LNTDDVPDELLGVAFRVGWVGGGLEPEETAEQCVRREAREEIGSDVELVRSPVALAWSWETRELRVEDGDGDGALVVVRFAGDRFAVAYGGRVAPDARLRPGDDVAALLLLPRTAWPLVERGVRVDEAVAAGGEVVGREGLPEHARLWLHPRATLRVAVPLLAP
jgi:8-oxo-dGTP pyrophosphatase MutT (NUDIX family)